MSKPKSKPSNQTEPDPIEALAARIAAKLFREYEGREARRLVMEFEGERPATSGWSQKAAANVIEDEIRAAAKTGDLTTD